MGSQHKKEVNMLAGADHKLAFVLEIPVFHAGEGIITFSLPKGGAVNVGCKETN